MEDQQLKLFDGGNLAWVQLVLNQISTTEKRILDSHQEEHARLGKQLVRFEQHLDEVEEEKIRLEARLGPIRNTSQWIYREWRTLLLVALVLIDILNRLFPNPKLPF